MKIDRANQDHHLAIDPLAGPLAAGLVLGVRCSAQPSVMTVAVINVILTFALPIYEGRQGPSRDQVGRGTKPSQARTVIWSLVIIQAGPHSTGESELLHGGTN